MIARFKNSLVKNLLSTLAVLAALSLAGCPSAEDGQILAERQRLLLTVEPTNPAKIADAKQTLADADRSGEEIVLIGRVGHGDVEPFETDRATFVISELLPDGGHAGDAGHDASTCPFCKRRAAEAASAVVRLVDANGQDLTLPADRILPLAKGDVVVVRGHGKLNPELNLFTLTASGVYIRR
jgi:hypothetical protein